MRWAPALLLVAATLAFMPALLLALKDEVPGDNMYAWLAILAVVVPTLMHFNNGSTQIGGQRFSLDFPPILLTLVARGAARDSAALSFNLDV